MNREEALIKVIAFGQGKGVISEASSIIQLAMLIHSDQNWEERINLAKSLTPADVFGASLDEILSTDNYLRGGF